MYRGKRIAVVMPAYNVAGQLERAILSVPAFVDHLFVVDDGSCDRTAAVARAAGRQRVLWVLRHAKNRGVGAAIATGYRAALLRRADVVAVMAGDGQMDPVDLPRLLDPVVEGRADYAKGNRFRDPSVWRRMPKLRIVGNIGLSLLTKITSGYLGVFDSQCGFTAISSRTLSVLGCELYPRYGYPNQLLARLRVASARVVDVRVSPIYNGEPSGVRVWTVFHPIPWVLLRSLTGRVWLRTLRPLLLRRRAPTMKTHAHRNADHLLPAPRR